jgi:hypothetical protein
VILEKTYQSPSKKHHAMTANHGIDPAQFLSEHLEHAEPDLLRAMLASFIDALMGAEDDALCGGEPDFTCRHKILCAVKLFHVYIRQHIRPGPGQGLD